MPDTDEPRRALSKPLVVVVGPTAAGKSALAQRLAYALGYRVLGADSMQVYRGMDIGTGKLPASERIVEHYGIDLVEPSQAYSAALYQTYGRDVVETLDAPGSGCVVCGGTGFYVRALVDDYEFPPGEQVGNAIRDRYNEMARHQGALSVWQELEALDPESAALVEPNDTKRVVRALEMHAEGNSYARQKEALASIPAYYPAVFIGLHVEPARLVARIDRRVEDMFEQGLVAEVESLLDKGLKDALTSRHAIGYVQVADYLEGAITLDKAIEETKVATHRYAKRQRTWFRKDARIAWIEAEGSSDGAFEKLLEEALGLVQSEGSRP